MTKNKVVSATNDTRKIDLPYTKQIKMNLNTDLAPHIKISSK